MKNLQSIGGFIAIMGVASILLYQFGYELKLLSWIDNWGMNVGWTIRGALLAIGGGLWFVGFKSQQNQQS
ncbi:MAG: hypothetical protein ABUK01_07485 [Leptospirales bacterium]